MTAKEVIEKYQTAFTPSLTDASLARLLGVNKSTICRIKKGERKPSNTTWNLIFFKSPRLYKGLQDFYHNE